MTAPISDCLLCSLPSAQILREGALWLVVRDAYPVTPLHTLIVTKRHVATYFDLNEEERQSLDAHLRSEREASLAEDEAVSGFNVGMNCGADAGQTIFHCHVHLIPRRAGDVDDPRGGVRGVIPDRRID